MPALRTLLQRGARHHLRDEPRNRGNSRVPADNARAAAGRVPLYPFRDSHSIRETDDGCCLFYGNGCRIYAVRPQQCRSYPFWLGNLRSKRRWHTAMRACPGIGRGRLYTRAQILSIVRTTF